MAERAGDRHRAGPGSGGRRPAVHAGVPGVSPAVPAWLLTPGSELPGEVTVLDVRREAARRTVHVLTDTPGAPRTTHSAEDLVDVIRLGP